MREFLLLSILALLLQHCVAPPVNKVQDNNANEEDGTQMTFEYERYLREIVEALESDDNFRQKLDKAEEADIRSGKIAHELEFVSHHVRTKLDEIKRTELERLKALKIKMHELDEKSENYKKLNHLDMNNHHTFEIEDLKKLIAKTTEDLAEADKKRREDFKEYEMQKKFEEEQKLKGKSELSEEEKKKYAAELEEMKEKHKKHEPLHHPGSKQQLEEVWEKQDHMQDQEFNPKTFFYMHDLDGNGLWDQDEVKALFLKELDKMYSESPEDDLRERAEEMERMREHVFAEADTNHDGFIDYEEFTAQTKRDEFKKDEGWKPLDEQEIYSQQEYEAFEKQREEEIQRLIAQGLIPAHPDYGHHGQFPQHPDPNQVHHQNQVPVQPQQYPGQVPVQHQPPYQGQPIPNQQQYQGQVPVQQQQYQGQVPVQQQQYQGQVPVQQHPGQVPVQQQQYQGQVPVQQQQYQGQVPAQQQQHPGQVPVQQQQQHQGQVPVQQQQHPGQVPVQQQQQQGQVPVQQNQIPQGQQQIPQQVPRDQVPPSGQFQPDLHQQQQLNQQNFQANAIPQNQVHQQQINQPQGTGQAPVVVQS